MKDNPLKTVGTLGQSIWLDYIRRDLIESGDLQKLIDDDGLRGMTSNPTIFEEGIASGRGYDDEITALAKAGKSINEIYESITQNDVRKAADAFRPLYDSTEGRDGYVSLEVNPHLAHNSQGTMDEARRLWAALDRPNVLIKIPATSEGLPVIKHLISEGINVNVTLLFGASRYKHVADAYMSGIEARARREKPLAQVASVASFFVSRIDGLVDPLLDQVAAKGGADASLAANLRGQVAIASSKMVYQVYKDLCSSSRFSEIGAAGARPQRLLWASTSTKNRQYSDVKYVEALIGRDTIDTLPLKTLNDYRDHGQPKDRIEEDMAGATKSLEQLMELGISIAKITQQLEDEGIQKFCKSYDKLMATLQRAAKR